MPARALQGAAIAKYSAGIILRHVICAENEFELCSVYKLVKPKARQNELSCVPRHFQSQHTRHKHIFQTVHSSVMSLSNTSAFYIIYVKLIGDAAKDKPADQVSHNTIAYIPNYDGKLGDLTALPYREKIVSHLLYRTLDPRVSGQLR